MSDEVLKFGSMIVDALVEYQQPLFVYIPPFAELRGGAWVVVDHTINKDVMEFYAAEDARGGVLEATGIASIKYRDPEIKATAHRLDPVLVQLRAELESVTDREMKSKIEKQIQTREKMLMGVYRQIAVHFADLHDTPGRMQAKGVIRKQVPWAHSRKYFFWRLRRRLAECEVASTMMEIDTTIPDKQAAFQKLYEWHLQSTSSTSPSSASASVSPSDATTGAAGGYWEDDRKMMCWLQENKQFLREKLTELKSEVQVSLLAKQLTSILHDGEADTQRLSHEDIILKAMKTLSGADAAKIKEVFAKLP
jgi:acetyl-CoA carboxylase / biotin carboxylase 1